MFGELAHFALILGFAASLLACICAFLSVFRGLGDLSHRLRLLYQLSVHVQFVSLSCSIVVLGWIFVSDDFSVSIVRDNSHSLQPLIYKVTALWGNHEGSLLLWVWVLSLFSLLHVYSGGDDDIFAGRVACVQALLACGFLALLLYTSNPFVRLLPYPPEGRSLNPLLQDIGLVIHPPLLYMGYVGLSINFSLAIASLWQGDLSSSAIVLMRRFALISWGLLTAGIGLGSWWAYYELGWGGFWFWDPVENASFIPWLVVTSLLHSCIVAEKRGTLKVWTLFLSLSAFSLSLLGTFLVRSGVLTSVHAFASDSQRGLFILLLLSITIMGGFALLAYRANRIKDGGVVFSPLSREGGLLVNNLLLCSSALVVLIGTLFPLFSEALGAGKITVGPPYFHISFLPLMVVALVLLGGVPLLAWKRGNVVSVVKSLRLSYLVFFVSLLLVGYYYWGISVGASLALAFGFWLIFVSFYHVYVRILGRWHRLLSLDLGIWGMFCAHCAMGVVLIGVSGASLLSEDKLVVMGVGDVADFRGYEMSLVSIGSFMGENYYGVRGDIELSRSGSKFILFPERRLYIGALTTTTEASVRVGFLGDYYVTISEQSLSGIGAGVGDNFFESERFVVHIRYKAFVSFIWFGCGLLVLGAILSIIGHGRRNVLGVGD